MEEITVLNEGKKERESHRKGTRTQQIDRRKQI